MSTFFVLNPGDEIAIPENYTGFVIFYKKNKDAAVAAVQINLLTKLIENGLKLKPDNFLFIDITAQRVRFSSLKKAIAIKKCFLFGVEEKETGINFDIPLYHLTNVSATDFLKADAPEILEHDKHLKNKLWTQLQISFKQH